MPKPGCDSSLVGPCLGRVVMRSQEEEPASGRSGTMPWDSDFSLNPKYNDLFYASPRLTCVSGKTSHPGVFIIQLGLPGRCWSRSKGGRSQCCIGEKLTCDFRLWLSLVTPQPGFSCVLRQGAVVSVLSGAQLALAGISLASHLTAQDH